MNVLAPVKSIMTTKLLTVNPKDKLMMVKEIFDTNNIHHVPVVRYKEIVGLISKVDFMHFIRGFNSNAEDRFVNEARLRAYNAEDIMTKNLATVTPEDRINVAIEIFKENLFHALPVVEDNELVGIVTTLDVIRKLAEDQVTAAEILAANKDYK